VTCRGVLLVVVSLLCSMGTARAQDQPARGDEARSAVMGDVGGVEIALERAIASFREGDADESRSWLAAGRARAPRRAAIVLASRATHHHIDPAIVLTLEDDEARERLAEIARADERRSLGNALGGAAIALSVGAAALPFVGVLEGLTCHRSPAPVADACSGRFGGYVAGSVLTGTLAVGLIAAAIAMQVIASDEVNAWLRRLRAGSGSIALSQW
jgi:hypothetical protein